MGDWSRTGAVFPSPRRRRSRRARPRTPRRLAEAMARRLTTFTSLWDLIEQRAADTPEARFVIDEEGRTLTFSEYRDAALRAAAAFHARGIGVGDVVSWQLPTWIEAMMLVGGLARLGAVQNPILPIYREREVGFV